MTNFRGIELRDFPAEVARLALIIAEFQCDVLYRGQKEALQDFLPLDAENWITCGNALRLDWLRLMDAEGTGVKLHSDDLFSTPLDQAQIDFENAGSETYICGNPPYVGDKFQTAAPDASGRSHYHHREPLFSPQRNLLLQLYSDYCKPELALGSGIGSKILRLATREARAGGFVEYDGKRLAE